jgi:hypothetical protein
MGEKEPDILEFARGNVRCRVLAEEHFEFRGGSSGVPVVERRARKDQAQIPRAREARLRPEYAQAYPCLTPDVWEVAAVVTEKVVTWQGYRSRAGNRPGRPQIR